jgi:drug/metabolite transporter (DMT)-like permease
MHSVMWGVAAAAAFGLSDFLGGLTTRAGSATALMRLTFPFSAVGVLVLAVLIGGVPQTAAVLVGAASGVVLVLATSLLYRALSRGPMAIVSPLSAGLTTAIPCVLGVLLGERLSSITLVGVALAIGAVALVAVQTGGRAAASVAGGTVVLTLGSGAAFAASYALLYAGSDAAGGLWPLAAARVAAAATVFTLPSERGGSAPLRPAVAIALLDVVGNVAMVLAFIGGGFAGTSVVVSLFPVVTVAAAIVVLHEAIRPRQFLAMASAVLAVGLIASG